MSRETEAKFTVSDLVSFNRVKTLREVSGFTLSDGETVPVRDTYQDTPGRSLLAAGWALRFRERAGQLQVTAKSLTPPSGVIHEREELEIELDHASPPPQWPDSELQRMVVGIIGEDPLAPLFEVRQERFVRVLAQGSRVAAEMSLDQVRVIAGGRESEYLELEVELRPGGTREELLSILASLRRDLSLIPSPRSKFEEGLLLLDDGRARPRPRRPARTAAPLRSAARGAIRVLYLEDSAATTEEGVHAELERLGYRLRNRSNREETRSHFDTQGGSLYRQGFELFFTAEDSRWRLLREGRAVHAQKGGRDAPPDGGPIARSVQAITRSSPCVPYMEALLKENVLSLASISATSLGLTIGTWQVRSLLHEVPTQTVVTLGFDRLQASTLELDYLVGLLKKAFKLGELDGPFLVLGLSRLGVPLPGAPLPQQFLPAQGDDVAVVCGKILSGEAWRMKANTPGALRDLDPEFVHDLRVATRRARFAGRLFVDALGAKNRDDIRTELSWIAGALGAVRDLDVLRGRLEGQLAMTDASQPFRQAISGVLDARRSRARDQLVPALSSPRYTALLELMAKAVPASPGNGTPAPMPADEFGRIRIRKALAKIGPWTRLDPHGMSPDELHRLRILFKRLRYTAEFFRLILDEDIASLVKECVAYQDCLGLHQDARVAVEVFSGLAQERALCEPADGLLALGALIQIQRDVMRAQRERLVTIWESARALVDLWVARLFGDRS